MPIDASAVKWDDDQIDLSKVSWDEPAKSDFKVPSVTGIPLSAYGVGGIAGMLSPDSITNAAGGFVSGAKDIGATLLSPIDALASKFGINNSFVGRNDRRQASDAAIGQLSDPDSAAFTAGKIGSYIAGTAGLPMAAGAAIKAIPGAATALPTLLPAIESGGFSLGAGGKSLPLVQQLAARAIGGGMAGGGSAGMINPDQAGTGAAIGAVLPVGTQLAAEAGNAAGTGMQDLAKRLMWSALKPTLRAQQSGDADIAVKTMLDKGLNVSTGGVEKLESMIDDINSQVSGIISNSNKTIPRRDVMKVVPQIRRNFANQVDPTADIEAIRGVASRFGNDPRWIANPQTGAAEMPIQTAQAIKQGTYKVLSGKYGEMGSAATEAQKGLARGLKDAINAAEPAVIGLNAQESALIKTLDIAERRALMQMNNNPMGLASLAANPKSWGAFMADKSALFKSLAARMLYSAGGGINKGIEGISSFPSTLTSVARQRQPPAIPVDEGIEKIPYSLFTSKLDMPARSMPGTEIPKAAGDVIPFRLVEPNSPPNLGEPRQALEQLYDLRQALMAAKANQEKATLLGSPMVSDELTALSLQRLAEKYPKKIRKP